MITAQIGRHTVKLPDAADFDLLILEAERLIGSRGSASILKGGKVAVEGIDRAAVAAMQTALEEGGLYAARVHQVTARAIRNAMRGTVWAVAGTALEIALLDIVTDAGMDSGMELATNPERANWYRNAVAERLIGDCGVQRDTRSKMITLHAIEERRAKGQIWLDRVEGWGRRADPFTEGVLKAYAALVESMLVSILAAYQSVETGRGPRGVKTKRVRASRRERLPGRPRKGSETAPRRKGQWRKKHPTPADPV